MDLAIRASVEAVEDAGLRLSDIGGLVCFHENDAPLTRDLAASAGLPTVHVGGATSSLAAIIACAAIGEAAMADCEWPCSNMFSFTGLSTDAPASRMGQFRLDSASGVRQFMLPVRLRESASRVRHGVPTIYA